MEALEACREADPGREVTVERLDTGTDGAVVADRAGADRFEFAIGALTIVALIANASLRERARRIKVET